MVRDLFDLLGSDEKFSRMQVFVSYFEIYGGRCQDLLNNGQRLTVREDGSGEVVVGDLQEIEASGGEALQSIIETGNRIRTTHATESNEESSRSHAICQIALRIGERQVGRLSLIDLAGSERGADTKSHNRQRRMEGAEINKSLLALKECIRALDSNSTHVPYRQSKLTLVLKDSFTRDSSRTVMIANVSPAASSADHTLNTLRYADRIKERAVGGQAAAAAAAAARIASQPQQQAKQAQASPDVDALRAGRAGGGGGGAGGPMAPTGGGKGAANGNGMLPPSAPFPAGGGAQAKVSGAGAGVPRSGGAGAPLPPTSTADSKSSGVGSKIRQPAAAAAKPSGSGRASEAKQQQQQQQPPRGKGKGVEESPRVFSGSEEDDEEDAEEGSEDDDVDALHRTVQLIFEEEEALLNLHMNTIQENAELLTEEGRLLQQIQSDDNDIDAYASRLDAILQRKQELITVLKDKLTIFRRALKKEEKLSSKSSQQSY